MDLNYFSWSRRKEEKNGLVNVGICKSKGEETFLME